jgi:hypothetical protein
MPYDLGPGLRRDERKIGLKLNYTVRIFLGLAAANCLHGAALAADAPAPKAYVGAFCGPIALSNDGTTSLMAQLTQWEAKGASDVDADAARPQDAEAPGQFFRFPDPAAPAAFVDRRRGVCTLVYPTPRTPDAVAQELATEKLPVNGNNPPSPWRKTSRVHFGPPGPIRYFLKVGESEGFGLCTTIFEDLRLKDGSPATMVRVSTCRLAPDEKLDNG